MEGDLKGVMNLVNLKHQALYLFIMKTHKNKADPKKRKHRLTKEQVLEYYRRMSYPHEYTNEPDRDPVFVPAELQLKAFEKLILWSEVPLPQSVADDSKPQKWIVEIKTAE